MIRTNAKELSKKISSKSAKLGVIGMGYVGLPLSLLFAEAGFFLTGFDVDQEKVQMLNTGKSYIKHVNPSDILTAIKRRKFIATEDFSRLVEMDVIIICVPTPLAPNREPDLQFVISTSETIAKHLKSKKLIILESTTYPGTTKEIVKPILQAGGLVSGQDFFLAYSPEREDPGNVDFKTRSIPKVLGGDGADACDLTNELYREVISETVPVSNMDTAEAAKLTENIFRAVNIALVNELKLIYTALGIDIWEVIAAASTKPFGFMPFFPGPGLGGHCIPIDPFYLSWRARQVGLRTRFIELSGEINRDMPLYVVNNLCAALMERFNQTLRGASVLIVGIAYKKNCDDLRESPALAIIELLESRGAITEYHDPYIPKIGRTREYDALAGRVSMPLEAEKLKTFDGVLICADHDSIDYEQLVNNAQLVVDTRNATATVKNRERVVLS